MAVAMVSGHTHGCRARSWESQWPDYTFRTHLLADIPLARSLQWVVRFQGFPVERTGPLSRDSWLPAILPLESKGHLEQNWLVHKGEEKEGHWAIPIWNREVTSALCLLGKQ